MGRVARGRPPPTGDDTTRPRRGYDGMRMANQKQSSRASSREWPRRVHGSNALFSLSFRFLFFIFLHVAIPFSDAEPSTRPPKMGQSRRRVGGGCCCLFVAAAAAVDAGNVDVDDDDNGHGDARSIFS